MKEKLFRDFLEAEIKTPGKIWRFYLISLTAHIVLIGMALSIPMTPTDVAAWLKRHAPNTNQEKQVAVASGKRESVSKGYFSVPHRDPLEEEMTGSAVFTGEKPPPGHSGSHASRNSSPQGYNLRSQYSRNLNAHNPYAGNADILNNGSAPVSYSEYSLGGATHRDFLGAVTADMTVNAWPEESGPDARNPGAASPQTMNRSLTHTYTPPRGRGDLVETDEFLVLDKKPFELTGTAPQSTFSTRVGTLSYPAVSRALRKMELPQPDEIKIEEMINYFYYDYPQPTDSHPIAVITETGPCPWNPKTMLLHIGMKGKTVFGNGLKDSQYVIADDVKVLVSFNPRRVRAHRLIGYGRQTPKVGPWNYEKIRGGNMWAGQRVTTLYEFIPGPTALDAAADNGDPATEDCFGMVTITYKNPMETDVQTIVHQVTAPALTQVSPEQTSGNYSFAAAVALFGLLLDNPASSSPEYLSLISDMAGKSLKNDPYGHRKIFMSLVENFRKINDAKQKESLNGKHKKSTHK